MSTTQYDPSYGTATPAFQDEVLMVQFHQQCEDHSISVTQTWMTEDILRWLGPDPQPYSSTHPGLDWDTFPAAEGVTLTPDGDGVIISGEVGGREEDATVDYHLTVFAQQFEEALLAAYHAR